MTRPAGIEWLINVRASALDPHADFVPFIETYASERLPWATTPARHSFPTLPPPEDYQPLMEAFAKQA